MADKCKCEWCKVANPMILLMTKLRKIGMEQEACDIGYMLDYTCQSDLERDGLRVQLEKLIQK